MIILGCNTVDSRTKDFFIQAIEHGFTEIDTAEIYSNGQAEVSLGEVIQIVERSKIKIDTKVSPQHFTKNQIQQACENSLKRLNTDYIDLYQLHWPNFTIPTEETLDTMLHLKSEGKIRQIGISNYSLSGLQKIDNYLAGHLDSYQGEFNIFNSSYNMDLLQYCKTHNIRFTGYSVFKAKPQQYTNAAVINWCYTHNVVPIIKTYSLSHLRQNISFAAPANYPIQPIMYKWPQELNIIGVEGYKTLAEALENKQQFYPPITDMKEDLQSLKPIHVLQTKDKFQIIGGIMRYWAWVLFKPKEPIPCIILQEEEHEQL